MQDPCLRISRYTGGLACLSLRNNSRGLVMQWLAFSAPFIRILKATYLGDLADLVWTMEGECFCYPSHGHSETFSVSVVVLSPRSNSRMRCPMYHCIHLLHDRTAYRCIAGTTVIDTQKITSFFQRTCNTSLVSRSFDAVAKPTVSEHVRSHGASNSSFPWRVGGKTQPPPKVVHVALRSG